MRDTLLRDVRYAWRTLRRAPLAAATIVVTVGLGLGLVAAYGASILCIVAACAGAALIPALRAGRVNPLAALRQE